jgi:hypothetical protein
MDLTIGSLSFRFGALGSTCLSDPTKLDPSAGKTTTTAKLESSAGFSSKVNSPVSFMTTGNIEDTIEELDKIMENLDLGESTGHSDFSQNFSKDTTADFTTQNSGVSNNIHQVCVIITEAAEDNDGVDNILVNTQGNNPRNNCRRRKRKYMSLPENGE